MGVSVENQNYTFALTICGERRKVNFLSLEPLLGPLHRLNLKGIDWAIVGGESGPGARPLDPAWVTDIRDQCQQSEGTVLFQAMGRGTKEESRQDT